MAATDAEARVADRLIVGAVQAGDATALKQLALWALCQDSPAIAVDGADRLVIDTTGYCTDSRLRPQQTAARALSDDEAAAFEVARILVGGLPGRSSKRIALMTPPSWPAVRRLHKNPLVHVSIRSCSRARMRRMRR